MGYAARLSAERNYEANLRFLKKIVYPARLVHDAPQPLDKGDLNDFVITCHTGYTRGYSVKWGCSRNELRYMLVSMLDKAYDVSVFDESVKAKICWAKLNDAIFPVWVNN